eukprot:SAG25_NODE_443_length_7964_cov_171.205722_3_plen_46_part_00
MRQMLLLLLSLTKVHDYESVVTNLRFRNLSSTVFTDAELYSLSFV